MSKITAAGLALAIGVLAVPAIAKVSASPVIEADTHFKSLDALTIGSLRDRQYSSSITIEEALSNREVAAAYAGKFFVSGKATYTSVLASYRSDGLRIYARIDLPRTKQPPRGYPVVIFTHGWVGYEAAVDYHFAYTPDSVYAEMVHMYADAGFVVISPGYRGHGTIKGRSSDGRASMAAWDNATYISPVLYAIDTLNLVEGLGSLSGVDWSSWEHPQNTVGLDLSRISISGHSQGGDVALIALAVSGKGSKLRNRIRAGSILSGTFADRFSQLETFRPMSETPEAFLAGDGTWTGSALGKDGRGNPHFVFGWPSDSIQDPRPEVWTWQKERYAKPSVRKSIEDAYAEMYARLRDQVSDLHDARFTTVPDRSQRGYHIQHDPRVERLMPRLGAYRAESLITARLALHFPDRDFYSMPIWNRDLCLRINMAGGDCELNEYPGNNHVFRLSEQAWFSPVSSREAYRTAVEKSILLFNAD